MARPALDPSVVEQILAAPVDEDTNDLALRLGVSVPTVRKYRKQVASDRHEAARELIAEHVKQNVPDALSDLTALRVKAREVYEATGKANDGQLWLSAIKTTLEHVRPDDSDLDEAIAAELQALGQARQGGVPSPGPVAPPIH